MTAMQDLPPDILFEVLVHLDNLQQLWSAISSCRQLYQAFEQRRSLILRQVFKAQLNQIPVINTIWGRPGIPRRSVQPIRQALGTARAIVNRCKSTPRDALCLHAAAQDTYLDFGHKLCHDCFWGQHLVERCTALGEDGLALRCANGIWKGLIDGATVGRRGLHRDHVEWCLQASVHSDLAQKLVSMHLDAGRHKEAIDILRSCFELIPNFNGYGLLSTVLAYCQQSKELIELQLLPFFRERIVKAKARELNVGQSSRLRPAASRFRWTYCIVMVLTRADKHNEAIEAMSEALDLALEDRSVNPVPVGLSRKLIKMLQEQHRYSEGLMVRKRVLDALNATMVNTTTEWTSQLVAWTKEYTSDLRAIHRENEAISVEEQVWARLKARAAMYVDGETLYRARNAAWTLARSYRAHDDVQKADKVREDYESIANARLNKVGGDTRLLWPGTVPDAGLNIDNVRMHMPIMASRRQP